MSDVKETKLGGCQRVGEGCGGGLREAPSAEVTQLSLLKEEDNESVMRILGDELQETLLLL